MAKYFIPGDLGSPRYEGGKFYCTTLVVPHMQQSDNTDQSITAAGVTGGQVITFDTDVHHKDITRTSSSRFTIVYPGSYLICFSGVTMGAINEYIAVWLKKNGTNVANSNTLYQYKANNATTVIAVSFIERFERNDYFEFWTWGTSTSSKWDYTAAVAEVPGVTPARPACPSIIITAQFVSED